MTKPIVLGAAAVLLFVIGGVGGFCARGLDSSPTAECIFLRREIEGFTYVPPSERTEENLEGRKSAASISDRYDDHCRRTFWLF